MRFLRSSILAIGLLGLSIGAVACGGKDKGAETTNTTNPCGNPCGGGEATPPAGENPCGGGEANPCGGGEANPCGGGEENPCGAGGGGGGGGW
jgi:hypothetical protein